MRQGFIFSDAAGYPRRAARLRNICDSLGVHFVHLSPSDKPVQGSVAVDFPEPWLSQAKTKANLEPGFRHWSRCHLYAVLGARLLPTCNFYWLVEADVDGPSKTWERLLTQTTSRKEDGLWSRLYTQETNPEKEVFATHPKWVSATTLGSIIRISSAGLKVWEETAVETREIFTEHVTASVLVRAGLSIGKINHPSYPSFYHTGTMMFNPGRTAVEPCTSSTLLRHPIKRDDPNE